MKRLALKFGGTSVGTIEKIQKVAQLLKKRHKESNEIIVIISAMCHFAETSEFSRKKA